MPPKRGLHELLGGISGTEGGFGPTESLDSQGIPGQNQIGNVGGMGGQASEASLGGGMGGEMPVGAPQEGPEIEGQMPGGGVEPQPQEMGPEDEEFELQQMQQAVEDPTTPPEVRQMAQMQLAMAARRSLALGGGMS